MNYLSKMFASKLLLPLTLVLLLPGCFRQIEYSKTITNDSDSPITVTFTCCGQEEEKSFIIEAGASQVVHACIYEGPGQVPDCNENPMDFLVFDALGEPLEANIQDSRSWDYLREEQSITCNFSYRPAILTTKSSN